MGIFFKKPMTAAAEAYDDLAKVIPIDGNGRAVAKSYGADRSLLASARVISSKEQGEFSGRRYSQWQAEAWNGYERVGEIQYGFNLVANILSRLRIYCGALGRDNQVPRPVSDAKGQEVSSELAEAAEGAMRTFVSEEFSPLMRAFSLNISVAGECYLVQLPESARNGGPAWQIKSSKEIQVTPTQVTLNTLRGGRLITLNRTDVYIARIWRRHPAYSEEPESSLMAIGDVVEELLLLQRLVRSSIRSRLNAGMLFVPDSIIEASKELMQYDDVDAEGNTLIHEEMIETFSARFMRAMTSPVSEEDDVSNVVPFLVTGPADEGEKIKYTNFDRPGEQWLADRQERALERVLQGIDVPKEVVTGLANVKYSNALVIDENLYKANIEPMALMFCDALTEVYLRPVLLAQGFSESDVMRVAVWYDPSEIVTRPNQSADASEGFDKGIINEQAWRREHGFSDTDSPDESERALKMLADKGTLPEDVTLALLRKAFPSIMAESRAQNVQDSPVEFPDSAQELLQSQQQQEGTEK